MRGGEFEKVYGRKDGDQGFGGGAIHRSLHATQSLVREHVHRRDAKPFLPLFYD